MALPPCALLDGEEDKMPNTYMRLVDNVVVETWDCPDGVDINEVWHPDLKWQPAPDSALVGMRWDGRKLKDPPPHVISPAPPRVISRKAWNDAVVVAGKIEAWFAVRSDESLGVATRLYFDTGGQNGDYLETNAKLKRLAFASGIDVKAIFDAATG